MDDFMRGLGAFIIASFMMAIPVLTGLAFAFEWPEMITGLLFMVMMLDFLALNFLILGER